MRWLFVFLLALNVFYYVWNQQQAPLRAKEITPLSLYKSERDNIRLLHEPEAPSMGVGAKQ
ncbi:hypothetical protein EGJ52_05585 [Pseudomonas luteola]|uniref:Uncharacterized protein n=1 Tax=Pseudomonas lutea TaxID=243924 RepID=A0A9X8MCD9_9PSED|nr:hypothetical protein EAW52_06360 [Pseudomonas sp. LTJR-52]RRW46828.1 hypothetical protein EGJ52_05585 [Pseudomonas luteola]SEQ43901.1 hypothetical protein SAMN05216409_105412 [Pseudomonas lutea]